MKVKIVDVKSAETHCWVRFESSSGCGEALCRDGTITDRIGEEVSVELDVDCQIDLKINAVLVDGEDLGLRSTKGHIDLVFDVEGQDEDGMTYCRVGTDCLIMIESEETLREGARVKMMVPMESVQLTPI